MKRERGMTLVELMIAAALGLLLLAGISAVYVNSKNVYKVEDAVSRLQENGRFAIDLLQREIRMAGYQGCNGLAVNVVNTLNNATGFNYDFSVGIQGFQATGSGWNPPLDASIAGVSPPPLPQHDVLTVRKITGDTLNLTPPFMGDTSADLHADAPNGIKQGDILLVSDCSGAAIFQVTNSNPGTSGSLVHNLGTGFPGNATKNLGKTFMGDATLGVISTTTYYIAPSSVSSIAGTRSLWRLTGGGQPEELVEGIDDLEILYGVDTDNDRSANEYLGADAVTDWSRVVSVKIAIVARTLADNVAAAPQSYSELYTDPTTVVRTIVPTDRRLSAVFSAVVDLRNRSL